MSTKTHDAGRSLGKFDEWPEHVKGSCEAL